MTSPLASFTSSVVIIRRMCSPTTASLSPGSGLNLVRCSGVKCRPAFFAVISGDRTRRSRSVSRLMRAGPSLSSTRLLWSKLKWKTCASIASSEAAAFRPRASPRFGQALSIAGIVDRRPVTDWCNRVTALPSVRCSECVAVQKRHDKHHRNRCRQ